MALRTIMQQVVSRQYLYSVQSLLLIKRSYSSTEQKFTVIEFEDLKDKVLNRKVTLIDVREPSELKEDGKIPQSVNIPLGQIADAFKMNDSDFQKKYGVSKPKANAEPFVLTCKKGKRVLDAFEKLSILGYKNVHIYSGSFLDWVKKGGPVEK